MLFLWDSLSAGGAGRLFFLLVDMLKKAPGKGAAPKKLGGGSQVNITAEVEDDEAETGEEG